jgi:hypothetical protein
MCRCETKILRTLVTEMPWRYNDAATGSPQSKRYVDERCSKATEGLLRVAVANAPPDPRITSSLINTTAPTRMACWPFH